ncbi:hypothetical protein BASA81_016258 [Batrachochytrium salamandrivorans]|nr:hypothetical protein BASA81_016258 [Batrachochytrium salamandrivorans]
MLLLTALALLALHAVAPAAAAESKLAGSGKSFFFIQANGQVYAFGYNFEGNLGAGNRNDGYFPAPMLYTSNAVEVAAANEQTCVLEQGAVRCAGRGSLLGNGQTSRSTTLTQTSSLEANVTRVYTGLSYSCALLVGGVPRCWGYNTGGVLANGNEQGAFLGVFLTPTTMTGLAAGGVQDLGLGALHSCLIMSGTGKVYCCGTNSDGQLGLGDRNDRSARYLMVPTTFTGAVSIACGSKHTCAVTSAGDVYCWGNNELGQLGQGVASDYSAIPLLVPGLGGGLVASVAAGATATVSFFVLSANGSVLSSGYDASGAAGGGDNATRLSPAFFANGKAGIKEIRGGSETACVLLQDGAVQCVGSNQYGQLGRELPGDSLVLGDLVFVTPAPTAPTLQPTLAPTRAPTLAPTRVPTLVPTGVPTQPTLAPTLEPTWEPTTASPSVAKTSSGLIAATSPIGLLLGFALLQ